MGRLRTLSVCLCAESLMEHWLGSSFPSCRHISRSSVSRDCTSGLLSHAQRLLASNATLRISAFLLYMYMSLLSGLWDNHKRRMRSNFWRGGQQRLLRPSAREWGHCQVYCAAEWSPRCTASQHRKRQAPVLNQVVSGPLRSQSVFVFGCRFWVASVAQTHQSPTNYEINRSHTFVNLILLACIKPR